jgi:hypothetical protein
MGLSRDNSGTSPGAEIDISSALRTAALKMAGNTFTSVNYWMDMPLIEFNKWLDDAIKIAGKGGK